MFGASRISPTCGRRRNAMRGRHETRKAMKRRSAPKPPRRILTTSTGAVKHPVPALLGGGGGEGFRQHLEPTDKPRTLCGIQDGAMTIGEIGRPTWHPSHVKRFGRFDHDLQRPARERPGAHPAFGRDLNGPRRVDYQGVLVERASPGDTVRQALQRRTDGQRDVFRRGRCAKHAQLTHGVVATPHAIS